MTGTTLCGRRSLCSRWPISASYGFVSLAAAVISRSRSALSPAVAGCPFSLSKSLMMNSGFRASAPLSRSQFLVDFSFITDTVVAVVGRRKDVGHIIY